MLNFIPLSPQKAIFNTSKTFAAQSVVKADIDIFLHELKTLLKKVTEDNDTQQHEAAFVMNFCTFLEDIGYKKTNRVNAFDRVDFAIHAGTSPTTPLKVLLEGKRPDNANEFPKSGHELVSKALFELLRYYLTQRTAGQNQICRLVITNGFEWFIMDENDFDKYFWQNKKLQEDFRHYENEKNTEQFYKDIARPYIEQLNGELSYCYFNLKDPEYLIALKSPILTHEPKQSHKLITALFKVFSPQYLLKAPVANDSNVLNKGFYHELLYILGLKESKQAGKVVITRVEATKRQPGALIELVIPKLNKPDFEVALELVITWINRILFMKLLEGHLISVNGGNNNYRFLTIEKVPTYDWLDALFFEVLAKQPEIRTNEWQDRFPLVPYLNSSLFELTTTEREHTAIRGLTNKETLAVYTGTVLRDASGRNHQTGKMETLAYLFAFLDAYNFGAEPGEADIKDKVKTLISASVLGLIFEKINGYNEGSIFTPGYITMYMCRVTIQKALVRKFNNSFGWKAESLDDLRNHIADYRNKAELIKFNNIVNSLTVCDPAAGSGHFLVSALNEIIACKSKLGILTDEEGNRLSDWRAVVENDELLLYHTYNDKLFNYERTEAGHFATEPQRVMKTIFNEKRLIIENCIFGVDINPNSVKICRLRLWIELLKNAYYLEEGHFQALHTLPNIDINIKQGNSLLSRFPITEDLAEVFKKQKFTLKSYRDAVQAYKEAPGIATRAELMQFIKSIKDEFRKTVFNRDPRRKRLGGLKARYTILDSNQEDLFGDRKLTETERELEMAKIKQEIEKIEHDLDDDANQKLFANGFEWRFEFPEVLDDEGNYVGFEVVIGNPPYMRIQEVERTQPMLRPYYNFHYISTEGNFEFANLFFERAVYIGQTNFLGCLIFPHKFLNSNNGKAFRDYLKKGKYIESLIHFGANRAFTEVDTYVCIAEFNNTTNNSIKFRHYPFRFAFEDELKGVVPFEEINYVNLEKASELYGKNQLITLNGIAEYALFEKLYQNSIRLEEVIDVFVGLQTSDDDLYIFHDCNITDGLLEGISKKNGKRYKVEETLFKPFLMGRDVHRYTYLKTARYVFFPYKIVKGRNLGPYLPEEIAKLYPLTYKWLQENENHFKARESGKASMMNPWYQYIYAKNLTKFEQVKLSSMMICSNSPNITLDNQLFYHTTKVYSWLLKKKKEHSFEEILAFANSKVFWWFIKRTGDTLQSDSRTLTTEYIYPFPIPKAINPKIKMRINKLVKLTLNSKKANKDADTTPLEAEIDQLVYSLYNLTPEEIAIVEGL